MRAPLPPAFLRRPIAHRGLHDLAAGRPENSLSAVKAAVDAGYGVEIDLQLTRDGQPVVFHDYDLARLTGVAGPIRQLTLSDATRIPLLGAAVETIPTLDQVLDAVGGRVPLVIELKDQDGAMGPDVGQLEAATVAALGGYAGSVALMSFNPNSVAELARIAPDLPRGLVTGDFTEGHWPFGEARRARLRAMEGLGALDASLISHRARDLDRAQVQDLRRSGLPVLCWTIRTPEEEAAARRLADNITFEGYRPALAA